VEELKEQTNGAEGNFILSDSNELNLSKSAIVIIDIFSLSLNNKKLLNTVYNEIKSKTLEEEMYLRSTELITAIEKYFDEIRYMMDYPLTFQNVDFGGLFKAIDLKVEEQYESFLEKLIDYISIIQSLYHFSFIAFVNLKSFLAAEELVQLYEFFNKDKINVLLIENTNNSIQLDNEQVYIIDEDLCEIY